MLSSPDHSFVVPSISRDMRALYDAHFAFVWRYMAHRGAPTTALDDLVQNVFRIVREHPSRYDANRSRQVLVCMVARQVLREFRKRHASLAQQANPAADPEGEGPTTNFSREAAAQLLDAVLDGLTEMQREVVLLGKGERMSVRDISDALGVPESTVQLRLESAVKQMATLVNRLRTHPLWACIGSSSRDAAGLLEAAQLARSPTDHDRERIFAAMLAVSMTGGPSPAVQVQMQEAPQLVSLPVSLPAIAPLPTRERESAPPPPPMLSLAPSRNTVVVAGITAALVICVGMFGAFALTRAPESAQAEAAPEAQEQSPAATQAAPASERAEIPKVSEATVTEQPATPTPTVESAPAATPERPVRKARPVKHPAREPKRATADEAKELFAVQRALSAGETKLASDLLTDHRRRFPDSKLDVEREALRAQILCERGKTKAARRIVLELEAEQADPPLLAAVDQACTRD